VCYTDPNFWGRSHIQIHNSSGTRDRFQREWEQHSQSYFDSGNNVPFNEIGNFFGYTPPHTSPSRHLDPRARIRHSQGSFLRKRSLSGTVFLSNISAVMEHPVKCPEGAYNPAKPDNLGKFVNSGKVRENSVEFKIYSGNLSGAVFKMTQSETQRVKCKFARLQW